MPKTIADLGREPTKKPIIGKSLVSEVNSLQKRIAELEKMRAEENALLEAAGYDYDGGEAWALAMERLGRR
jgi:hypothetical protein